MTKFDKEFCPSMDIRTEKKIYIIDVSEYPTDDLGFQEWISYKSEELGTGEHIEYYAQTEDYKEDIKVHFYVELCTLQIIHDVTQL